MSIQKRTLKGSDNSSRRAKTAYLVRVEGPRDPRTGKRRQWSKQVPTMAEARSLEKSWEAEIQRGTAVSPSRLTVAELLDSWLSTRTGTISSNSIQDYEIAIRLHIKPPFSVAFWYRNSRLMTCKRRIRSGVRGV